MLEVTREGRIAFIDFRRGPVNALDDAFVDAIGQALDALRAVPPSVIVFRSAFKVFAAGADLNFLSHLAESETRAVELESYLVNIQDLFARVEAADAITVAEIGGAAMGAGLEFALSCDLRVVAESAHLALPEVGVGLLPAAGGTQRLTRLCGRGVATRVICAGDTLTSAQALAVGLVDYIVEDAGLRSFVDELARRIAAKPVDAMRLAKRCIQVQGIRGSDGFKMERVAAGELLGQPETAALIKQFLERSSRRASLRS